MIAERQLNQRFEVVSKLLAGNESLRDEIKLLTAELDAERARAERAEKLSRLYEAQLTQPRREVKTLMQSLCETRPEDITRADRDLAELRNQGWEVVNVSVTVYVIGMDAFHDRIVTLERVAPIPVEPAQPPAMVVDAATKTVTPSAIVIPGEIPALDPFDVELADALRAKADEIRRTNPLLNLPHRSFRGTTGVFVQP